VPLSVIILKLCLTKEKGIEKTFSRENMNALFQLKESKDTLNFYILTLNNVNLYANFETVWVWIGSLHYLTLYQNNINIKDQ
jgi:hypothetical protein